MTPPQPDGTQAPAEAKAGVKSLFLQHFLARMRDAPGSRQPVPPHMVFPGLVDTQDALYSDGTHSAPAGAPAESAADTGSANPMDAVAIRGSDVVATSPEGQQARISLQQLLDIIAPPQMSTCGAILPDGVKCIASRGRCTVWVYQRPPGVLNAKWLAADSPAPFGPGARYRHVRIALPYLIVLAVFEPGPDGRLGLSGRNECFFRTGPLRSLDDELLYPALLNCSKFDPPDGHPLSWICTAQLDLSHFARERDPSRRFRAGLHALLRTLLEAGFNYSSDHHEAASWFTESRRCDPRVASIERWEQATRDDELFVLDVPWLTTGMTLGEAIERIFSHGYARGPRVSHARDLARIVFNYAAR